MPKLDCERVQHLLSDHLDGVLSPDISSQLEEHLLSCGPCRINFESIRNLVGLAKDPRAFATPEGFSLLTTETCYPEPQGKEMFVTSAF